MINYDPGTEQVLDIIASELYIHPQLQPIDLLKALYQAAFGPFHIIKDKASVVQALSSEIWQMEQAYLPLQQNLGDSYSRVSLSIITRQMDLAKRKEAIELFADWVLASSKEILDAAASFKEIWRKYLPLMQDSLKASPEAWALAECHVNEGTLPSHSPAFHGAYQPHYRLVKMELTTYKTYFFGEA